jgi:RHS repeat-associated protein
LIQVLSDGTTTYTYGLGRISQQSGNASEYFLGDALGSVRQMTDNAGEVTFAKSYNPYGEVMSVSGNRTSIYAYTGEATDASGLTYLRTRYYSPADGRFLTKDPSGAESNLYTYARGNPVNRIDPTGLFSKETIENNININRFAVSTDSWKDHSKWGFYALLRNAENGDRLSSGYVPLGLINAGYQVIWNNPGWVTGL